MAQLKALMATGPASTPGMVVAISKGEPLPWARPGPTESLGAQNFGGWPPGAKKKPPKEMFSLRIVCAICVVSLVSGFQGAPSLASLHSISKAGRCTPAHFSFANRKAFAGMVMNSLGGRVGFGERQSKSGKQSPLEGGKTCQSLRNHDHFPEKRSLGSDL
jgi:hypothetical protein